MPQPLDLPFDPIARAAQTWRERFGPSDAMAAATSVMRVHQLLLAELDAVCRPHDLTFARYEALVLLTFSRTGALPMARIGQRLMVHPTSVTNTVQRLEQAGYVRREPNPRDGRGTLARITDAGREVVERVTADLMAADFGLRALGPARQRELVRLLAAVRVEAGDYRVPDGAADEPEVDRPGVDPPGVDKY
ncbi:MAG TPA: MarR family transcriptional regulator [Jiangellales bacterium]|nr:MarR family transcriptional regulator [Jiangellales bacterium]